MTALTHLAAAVDALTTKSKADDAKITDLQSQLDAAKAQPAGSTDSDLDAVTKKIEDLLGPIADPDASTGSSASAAPVTTVGDTATTATTSDGSTTTYDHTSGTSSTTDSTGATVETDQAAADAAKAAAAAAGVAVAGA